MYEAHYVMCAYVTLRGLIDLLYKVWEQNHRSQCVDINGRERLHTKGLVNVPANITIM